MILKDLDENQKQTKNFFLFSERAPPLLYSSGLSAFAWQNLAPENGDLIYQA